MSLRSAVRSRRIARAALLASVSALSLLAAGAPAEARNILVGSGASAAVANATAAAITSAQQAAAATQQSMSSLTRATQAIQAMQQAQSAAQSLALTAPSTVPNGLTAGGLMVDPRVTAGTDSNLWVNASLPTQSTSNGQTTVTILQTSQRAVLTWQQFNVGNNTIVDFDQSGGASANGNNWVALNRIDASGVPSQILGQIKADGTVLIINPNGIIFAGSSQINVHTLIASAEDINSYSGNGAASVGVFNSSGSYSPITVNGVVQTTASGAPLLAPADEDNGNLSFINNGLYINGGNTLLFSNPSIAGQGNVGVIVQPGASITANITGIDNGGYVALVGPQVSNSGSIGASSGQVILAAGNNVFISSPASTGATFGVTNLNPSQSLIYSPVSVPGGAYAVNTASGLLYSADGNITLVGDGVQQLGAAAATTSVNRPGSITLSATGLGGGAAPFGTVQFGPGSVTTIMPDDTGGTIVTNSISAFIGPSISISTTNMDMQPGSLIYAPSAAMTVTAGGSGFGRVLLESGSTIDLSGLDGVTVPVSEYLYTFKVTANDVADSPLADSLIGQTVTIDLALSGTRTDGETWVGSPLFASSGAGYLGDIPQSIAQLLTKGGSLNISAGADVISAPGSLINVAGGWIEYTGATIATTALLGGDGHIYNIGSANPFIPYVGMAGQFVVDHAHWGITQTYTDPLIGGSYYQPSYIDGVSGGSINVSAVNPVLEGTIAGGVIVGTRQVELSQAATGANGAQATPDQLPSGATLSITIVPSTNIGDDVVLASSAPDVLGPNFTVSSPLTLPSSGDSNPTITYSTANLSAADLGSISIKGAWQLWENAGASLSVLPGGKINLTGVSAINGALIAHGGSISLTGNIPFAAEDAAPPTAAVLIGPEALLDVSGLWVNDSGGGPLESFAYINGGTISIATNPESVYTGSSFGNGGYLVQSSVDVTQSIVFAPGSVVDLSSGGYVSSTGALADGADGLPKGNGGNLTLITYQNGFADHGGYNPALGGYVTSNNPVLATTYLPLAPTYPNEPNAASVYLGGTVYSDGFNTGGTFTLQVPIIQIGNATSLTSYFSSASITTLAAATGIPTTAFTQATSNNPAGLVALPTAFFTSGAFAGFSSYDLTSTYGSVTVAANTTLTLQQQNYLAPTSFPQSGALVRDFAATGTLPAALRQPSSLSLNQLAYNDGSQSSGSTLVGNLDPVSAFAGILLSAGAEIIADPKASISLSAENTVTVLGDIVAPAGSVAIGNTGSGINNGISLAASDVWIAGSAVLDVAGVIVPNLGTSPLMSGTALPGGTITLSGNVFALPGSVFDIAGAGGNVESRATTGAAIAPRVAPQEVWSNGGTLTLSPPLFGNSGLYFDGTIEAQGGAAEASGGTLNLVFGSIVIQQSGSTTATLNLASLATAGALYPVSQTELAALAPAGGAFINANTINGTGLDSVTLGAGQNSTIAFSGNVTLKIPDALTIDGNVMLLPAGVTTLSYTPPPGADGIPTIGATNVTLQAGYIDWVSIVNGPVTVLPTLADGTLTLSASAQIDLQGTPSANNVAQLNLVSGGDIRLIGEGAQYFTQNLSSLPTTGDGGDPSVGALLVADNLNITAREVYPETDTAFLIMSLALAPNTAPGPVNTIRIASSGNAPVAPLSANGAILIDAPTIVQGGVLWAPLGTIQLGFSSTETLPGIFNTSFGATINNPYDPIDSADALETSLYLTNMLSVVTTQSVTLGSGSLTSVSAAGLAIPYGSTVNDTNWSDGGVVLSGPPAKLIALGGASINTQTGAVIDASGGGDVYATEFVPGTGGSRNVLTTTTQTVYALVPGYGSALAADDPTFAATVPAGAAVTIAGGNGIPAGTYTLLPGMYATLPGAYRVVVVSTNSAPMNGSTVAADGSVYMTGTLGNAVTGARSSQTALLEIQSDAVWTKYSEIDITHSQAYFTNLAAANGAVVPQLPIDAGQLVIAADASLVFNATNEFTPAAGGRAGQADIASSNILIVAGDLKQSFAANSAYDGYLFLDVDEISDLGVGSVLIGGTRSQTAAGTLITADALNLEVATDAAHPLTGPELLLVTLAPTSPTALVNGLTIDSGSVIAAKGPLAAGSDQPLIIGIDPVADSLSPSGYTTGASGDGSLLRVSNGSMVTVTRLYVPGLYSGPGPVPVSATPLGSLTVDADASVSGNALTLDSSGTNTLPASASLQAQDYDLSGSIVNLGGGSGGLVLSPSVIAGFAGARSVALQSASVFNFYGNNSFGSGAAPIGTLTFDGSGFYSDGGATTVTAATIALTDSQATPNSNGADTSGAGGSLVLNAVDTVTFSSGTMSWGGFGQATVTAGSHILFTGTGSLNAGAANITLGAPAVVADAASVQSLTTTGALTIVQGAGTVPTLAATDIGGSLSLTAAGISDSGTVLAQGGTVILTATGADSAGCPTCGDVVLNPGATISATGTTISLFGLIENTPGGAVSLTSNNGNVTLNTNTLIDVSAQGSGYAGSVTIAAADGTATLNGTLRGSGAFKDTGGNFSLNADTLAGSLPLTGFTGSFAVMLGQGDIDIAAGETLTSGNVLLVANNGSVNVFGTIDASSFTGGTIALYGAGTSSTVTDINGNTYTNVSGGVTIGASARLLACYLSCDPTQQIANADDPGYANSEATMVQTGGTITLGTTGVPNGTLNATYGYENVPAPQVITVKQGQNTVQEVVVASGTIDVASGATFNVSGGPGGFDINNNGGTVYVRAPIMTNNNINVSFNGTVITNAVNGSPSGNGVVAESYAVWSTADQQTNLTKYFDGIIDPAGWFSANGQMVAGTWSQAELLALSSGGSNYTAPPTVTIQGAGWTNVFAQALMSATTGTVSSLASGGSGFVNGTYTCTGTTCTSGGNSITLTINTDGNGSGLSVGTVTVSGGAVTSFTITGGGSGYDNSISVSFTQGSATAASNLLNLTVSGLAIAPPAGSVLTGQTPSSVTFTGGGGSGAAVTLTGLTAGASATQVILNGQSVQEAAGIVLPGSGLFTPTTANGNHVAFYQTTLLNFVQNPFNDPAGTTTNTAAVQADFAGDKLQVGNVTTALPSSMLQLQPEIDLINPSTGVNGGNITVASNWNLGAGVYNTTTGAYTLFYRTTGAGDPGVLSLRAVDNIEVNATISDGFYETSDPFASAPLPLATAINTLTAVTNDYNLEAKFSTETMPGYNPQNISAPTTVFPSAYGPASEDNWYGDYYRYFIVDGVNDLNNVAGNASARYILTGLAGQANQSAFDGNAADYASASVFQSAQSIYGAKNQFDPNLSDYSSYATYIAAYNKYYVGSNFPTGETIGTVKPALSAQSNASLKSQTIKTFDNNPADYGSYADYALAYDAYVTAMKTDVAGYYSTHTQTNLTSYPSTILAPVPPQLGTVYATANGSVSVETSTLYVTDLQTHFYSTSTISTTTLYNAYISYYSGSDVEPGHTTGANSTTATNPLWLVALPLLVSPASVVVTAAPTLGNVIANNPGISSITLSPGGGTVSVTDFNTTAAAQTLIAGQSFSYNFTAGAYFPANGAGAVDPGAVGPLTGTLTGNVTVNGHTDYADAAIPTTTIPVLLVEVPTLVRTGTGSITIAAAGNFELLDQTSPGAVYTAGAAQQNVAGFTAPVVPLASTPNGLVSTPTWAAYGGNVTITAGRNIIGIETPFDADGTETGGVGVFTGQMWSAWYYTDGNTTGSLSAPFNPSAGGVQFSAWINYASFFQGIGALGGGNIIMKAGQNIYDISASLPETIQVSGGQAVGSPSVANYFGGGDLSVQAGGNIYSSAFYVGRGAGSVVAGGLMTPDPANPITGLPTQVAQTYDDGKAVPGIYPCGPGCGIPTYTPIPLVLAVQDGFISVRAAGSITTGGIYDPADIVANVEKDSLTPNEPLLPTDFAGSFSSQGPASGVAITSLAGNVETAAPDEGYWQGGGGLPSLFTDGVYDKDFTGGGTAYNDVGGQGVPVDPATLMITAIAGNIQVANNIFMTPSPTGSLVLAASGSIATVGSGNELTLGTTIQMLDATAAPQSILGTPDPTALTQPLHVNDPVPVIIYAGGSITGNYDLIKPAMVEAGLDIVNTTFIGQNNTSSEITSIIAGRDILAVTTSGGLFGINDNTTTITLYGPGDLLVEAGRNLGPFTTVPADLGGGGGGIIAVGNGSNDGSFLPYLPLAGANITTLFGVGPGIDYAAAINDYVNPANAGLNGIDYLSDIASILGVSQANAWTTFQQMSSQHQQLLVDRAFLDFLTQVGTDYHNPASPYYQQYARAYEAIATLFPASYGYTDNNTSGFNGAAVTVHTGDLNMAYSLIETQTGGNINILGPGGNIFVGANAADPLSPSQEGILTLSSGSISTYTDGSVQLYQSRIFTEQGGDIDMFSANGDLNAGKGPKSSAAYPPLSLICDVDGFCEINPKGLVTGAGIGALLSIPGQDPTKSNVVLTAPHGTIDAGAAGIRVAGNLTITATQVLNAFNITVGGTAIGMPTAISPNIGALTVASNTAGAAAAMATEAAARSRGTPSAQDLPSIITVEVIGYGGGNDAPPEQRRKKPGDQHGRDEQSYDPTSTFRVIGNGDLSDEQKRGLTEEERGHL